MRQLGRTLLRIALMSFFSIAAPRFLFAAPVANVDSTAAATLDGVVTDSLDQPVAGVEIISAGSRVKTVTNSLGAFSLRGIPPGAATFTVRKIGYGGGQFTLAMDPGVTLHQTIVLTRLNNVLTPVVVEESQVHRGLRDVGFYDRAGNARGTFLTPEILVTRSSTRATDLLRGVNGVRVVSGLRGGLPFSSGGYMKITGVGGKVSAGVCLMNLYIDGTRVEIGSAWDGGTGSGENANTLEDVISPQDIGAIEVYPSGVTSPQKYTGVSRGCGTILIWTKMKLNFPTATADGRH